MTGRVIPEREAHLRWCNVPDAMELRTVEWPEDPSLTYDWKGVCLHGLWVIGKGQQAEKPNGGRPKCGHPASARNKAGKCMTCARAHSREYRLRQKNPSISAGQEG